MEEYLKEIEGIPKEKIAYVDETGLDSYFYREYAYSLRGEAVHAQIPGRKFQRTNILAAQMGSEILAPMQYAGSTDAVLFETWFEKCLLPCLPEEAVIVMDNAAFHRKKQLYVLANRSHHRLIFLPPYSPELNPIEMFWAWLKRTLSDVSSQFSSLDDSIHYAFQVC